MRFRFGLVLVMVVASVLYHLQTINGMILTPDSTNYYYAANSLATGSGYVGRNGEFLYFFPPGYPIALAGMSFVFGGSIPTAAIWLGGAALLTTIAAAAFLVRSLGGNDWLALLAAVTIGCHPEVLDLYGKALSEGLSFAFAILGIRYLVDELDKDAWRWSVVFFGLTAVTRNASAIWIVVVVMTLIWIRHWRHLASLAIAGIPALLWQLLSRPVGEQIWGKSDMSFTEASRYAVKTTLAYMSSGMSGWFVLAGILAMIVLGWRNNKLSWWLVAAIATVSWFGAVIARTRVGIDNLNFRLMSFSLLLGIVLLLTWSSRRKALIPAVALSLLPLIVWANTTFPIHAPREFPAPAAQDQLCDLPAGELVISNNYFVGLRCYRPIAYPPRELLWHSVDSPNDWEVLEARRAGRCVTVIWLDSGEQKGLASYDELSLRYGLSTTKVQGGLWGTSCR